MQHYVDYSVYVPKKNEKNASMRPIIKWWGPSMQCLGRIDSVDTLRLGICQHQKKIGLEILNKN